MGVDFEVVSIGGEVSGEESSFTRQEKSIKWKVVLPGTSLTIKQTH